MTLIRDYDAERDVKAARRIWLECGWIDEPEAPHIGRYFGAGRAHVGELNGEAECLVITADATMRYLDAEISMGAVTGVTTSLLARRQGVASRVTARAIAADVQAGCAVSVLGIFDQGYYDKLGFGTGSYVVRAAFDPADLKVARRARPPKRITAADWEQVHAARLGRLHGHGAVNLLPPALTQAEMEGSKTAFGLGYADGPEGTLSHLIWFDTKNRDSGPYNVWWMAYSNYDQFMELMALIKSLGDQVLLVQMKEPPEIQLFDLIARPHRQHRMTEKAEFASGFTASGSWQIRMNDLAACLAATHLPGLSIRFNLQLSDPIHTLLDPASSWQGVGGEYVVTLGPESMAERGRDERLPTLKATVNAFTRLWLGVRPATSLAVTDHLSSPPELLKGLEQVLRLPAPHLDWDF